GSILVISPRERRPAPVIRDAAESLAAAAEEDTTAALPTTWAWAGLLAAFALVWVSSLPLAAWAALTAGALLLALWTRALSLVHLS
ncbi:type VII secretion integral membrane protein EccD, partial [Salmonella enterica subsp. enterica serovar Typhimurium]|nr:type VII secretion integral membrane protein EccD [Salmonella enterica subsp. enterica serovar Typhimurium]